MNFARKPAKDRGRQSIRKHFDERCLAVKRAADEVSPHGHSNSNPHHPKAHRHRTTSKKWVLRVAKVGFCLVLLACCKSQAQELDSAREEGRFMRKSYAMVSSLEALGRSGSANPLGWFVAKPYKWLLAIEFLAQNSTADSLVMWNLPA